MTSGTEIIERTHPLRYSIGLSAAVCAVITIMLAVIGVALTSAELGREGDVALQASQASEIRWMDPPRRQHEGARHP